MQTLKYAKFNINQDLASLAIVQVLEVEQTSDRLVNQKNNLFHLYLKNDQHWDLNFRIDHFHFQTAVTLLQEHKNHLKEQQLQVHPECHNIKNSLSVNWETISWNWKIEQEISRHWRTNTDILKVNTNKFKLRSKKQKQTVLIKLVKTDLKLIDLSENSIKSRLKTMLPRRNKCVYLRPFSPVSKKYLKEQSILQDWEAAAISRTNKIWLKGRKSNIRRDY